MSASFEPYRIVMTSWPGATVEALDVVLEQLRGAKTNGSTSFEEVEVALGERGVLTVSLISDGRGPWDACEFPRGIVADALADLCPGVLQDGLDEGEEAWCASLVVHHVEACTP